MSVYVYKQKHISYVWVNLRKRKNMIRILYFIFVIFIFISCNSRPKGIFTSKNTAIPVDYSNADNWAALPDKKDQADRTPHRDLADLQKDAKADVFFLHPTTYTRKRGNTNWNGTVNDSDLNQTTDDGTILNQASVFNGAGKVYAPRYRQAHIQYYYTKKDSASAIKAFEVAYQDVKSAFEYYLKHYNNGRPIIIASHSQGTNHAETLLKEFFDGKPLQDKLVAAYLVGMPIERDAFQNIKVCETPEQSNCFCSWRTFKHGSFPKDHQPNNNIAVTNPLTWTTDETYASAALNQGTVLHKFEKYYTKQLVDAQIKDGVLWVHKPKFKGSVFLITKNYHIADYNLFYTNVRHNAMLRLGIFLKNKK